MFRAPIRAAAIAVAAWALAVPASAAIVLTNYAVSGVGSGTFALGLDARIPVYSLNALNLTFGAAAFDASNSALVTGLASLVGGTINGTQAVLGNTNDFYFFFDPAAATQTVSVVYTNVGTNSTVSGNITIRSTVFASVPEPASWAMMLVGFGAIGLSMHRRSIKLSTVQLQSV